MNCPIVSYQYYFIPHLLRRHDMKTQYVILYAIRKDFTWIIRHTVCNTKIFYMDNTSYCMQYENILHAQ